VIRQNPADPFLSEWRYAWASVLAALVLMGFMSASAVNSAHAAEGATLASCQSGVVRDYEAALKRMPPDRTPAKGPLPFAPSRISLLSLNFGKTVLRGNEIGYAINVASGELPSGRLRNPIELRWEVRMHLTRVDRRGRPLRIMAEKLQRVGTVRYPGRPTFFLQSKPGVYRFEMEIRKWNGRLLKSYTRYVRVLPRRVKLRIAVNQREFQAGEVAIGRIENFGTLPAFLISQPYLSIEHLSDGEWRNLTIESSDAPFSGPEGVLLGGRAELCKRFTIPVDAPTGDRYRFSAVVEASTSGGLRRKTLTTPFSVD
jgi:hypothetical protein